MRTEQIRIGDNPQPARNPDVPGFATNEALAADLEIVRKDLRQVGHGLSHLEAMIPTLRRQVETQLELIERVQRRLISG